MQQFLFIINIMSSTGSISRITPHQEHILKTLETIDGEISTQDLYVRLRASHKTLGLATVYRGLEVLRLQELVQSRNSSKRLLASYDKWKL